MLKDLRFAMRLLRKQPGFSAIVALTVALGIGATSAVFTLIQGVLLTTPPYRSPEQLVLLESTRTNGQKMESPRGWPAQQWFEWRTEAKSLQDVAGYGWTFNFLVRNDGSQSMQGMAISSSYLRLMGLRPFAGRGFVESDFKQGPTKAILVGYEFWQRAFGGDKEIIGKTVHISRWQVPPTVVGVMEPGVRFLRLPGAAKEPNYDPNATVDFWMPAVPDPKEMKDPNWNVVARLSDGASIKQGQQELATLAARQAQGEQRFEGFTPHAQPLIEEMNASGKRILLPLLGAAVLVLFIACGNASALLLVRGLQRRQEYAVRSAMGMSRAALLRQVVTEALILSLFGGVLGVGLALGAVRLFKVIAGHAIPRLDSVTTGWGILASGIAAAMLAAFLAAVIPALRTFRLDLMGVIKSAGPKASVGIGERRLLAAVTMLQTALTLALLVGAGLLIHTMMKITQVASGFNTSHILTMSVTDVQSHATWYPFHRQTLERVASIPGVQYAAFAWGVPLTGNNWPAAIEIEGQPPALKESDKTALPLRAVTPDYFKLIRTPLTQGREFRSTDDQNAPAVAIVNQAFTNRFFRNGDVVGRKFWLAGRDKPATEIIGEIANGRTDDLTQEASPEIYLPLWQAAAFSKHLVVRTTANPAAAINAVQRAIHSIDPTAAIENVKTLDQIRDESLASRTFAMQLLSGFSVVGSILTLVGIYGLLSLSVASRRRELAIRSAVGAQQEHIRNLVFGEGFRLIAGGVLIGIAVAVLLSQGLRSLLYGVQPNDPLTLLVVGALFVTVGLLACWVPVRRASKVDPMEALRYE